MLWYNKPVEFDTGGTMEKKQRIILLILALIGLALSLELTHIFFKVNFVQHASASFCSISQLIDCDGVAKTPYSMLFGIPLALWGLLLYLVVIFLTFVDKIQARFKNTIFDVFKTPNSYIATIGLIAFICSMALASISIFKIQKICYLCFITYFIDLFIAFFAKSKDSFFMKDIKITIADFVEGFKKYTLLAIVVILATAGLLYYLSESLILSPLARIDRNFNAFINMKTNPYATKGNILGNKEGKIKVIVFSDFMCPYCKAANVIVHKVAQHVKNVEFIHYNYPLDNFCNPYTNGIHPGACELARFALAARKQDNYWGMITAIYDNHPRNNAEVLSLAESIGLDSQRLTKDAQSNEVKEELARQIQFAQEAHLVGTPSIMVSGILYSGAMPYDTLLLRIKQAQKRLEQGNN